MIASIRKGITFAINIRIYNWLHSQYKENDSLFHMEDWEYYANPKRRPYTITCKQGDINKGINTTAPPNRSKLTAAYLPNICALYNVNVFSK